MLQLSVKASRISNLTDARYFAAREVEWLGFNLDMGTDQAIPVQQVSAIKEWIAGPKIVGEFGLQSPDEIKSVVDYLQLDAIQVGMFADVEAISKVVDISILKEVVLENDTLDGLEALIQSQSAWVNVFIIDFVKNNISWSSLAPEDKTILQHLCTHHSLLFHLDITVEALPDFIQLTPTAGLVLQGGEEEKVGYKSFDLLDDILDYLEVEE